MLLNLKNLSRLNSTAIIGNLQAFRYQATAASAAKDKISHNNEWEQAKPYEELPPKSGIRFMIKFLPGGKYYKMDPLKMMLVLREELGPIFRFKGILGKKDNVLTYNVDDFPIVLRNEGMWPKRPSIEALKYHREEYRADFFKGVGGLLTVNDEEWAKFRSMANPVLMQPKNVLMYMLRMSQVNKEFIERIRQIRDTQTFEVPGNFVEEINRWTLESVSVVALDKQLGCINQQRDHPMVKHLFESVNGFFKYALEVEMNPFWKYYKTKSFKNLMISLDSIMHITNFYINEAIARLEQQQKEGKPEKPENEKSVLEKLLKMDRKIAKVMAMDMLMAGVDTTTSTMAGLLLCLAKNPSKQAKLREEVLKLLPQKDSEFQEESLKHIPYIRACIKESLRLYPVTLGVARDVANDVVLSGYRIPKGTSVSLIPTSLMNNEEYFPRPKEFLPERWLRSDNQQQSAECPASLRTNSPFVFLPFGFGPRSCIGRRIVEMELELGIARIIRNFHVAYNYPTENAFKTLLINVPNIPLKFKFTEVEK